MNFSMFTLIPGFLCCNVDTINSIEVVRKSKLRPTDKESFTFEDDSFLLQMGVLTSELQSLEESFTSGSVFWDCKKSDERPHYTCCTLVNDLFELRETIQEGSTSCVTKAIKKSTGQSYVLKKLCSKKHDDVFFNELKLLSLINHENIINVEGGYYDGNHYYICTEFCSGGNLFHKLRKLQHFPENLASNVIRSILNAIAFCHNRDIVHLDLKLENIVFANDDDDSKIVIIDWGFSKVVDDDEIYQITCGTRNYFPPECTRLRSGRELKKHDMFSIGIMTFILLMGKYPFNIQDFYDIERQSTSTILWNRSSFAMSPTARNFIESLLDENVSTRLTVEQALNHPWITRH